MKIRPLGAELFHAQRRVDGGTDRHDEANITVAFRNFANAPKNADRTLGHVRAHTEWTSQFIWQ